MHNFKTFLLERESIKNKKVKVFADIGGVKTTMNSKIGSNKGEDHFRKYMQPNHLEKNDYRFVGQHSHIPSGSTVKLRDVFERDGHRFAHVDHEGETHQVRVDQFNKPAGVGRAGKNQEAVEDSQVSDIHKRIQQQLAKTGKKTVRLHFDDGTHVDAAGFKKVTSDNAKEMGYNDKGKPKSDAFFHDENGNPIHHVSLKGHSQQQWGGVSHMTDHPAVQQGMKDIKRYAKYEGLDDGLPIRAAHYELDDEHPDHRDLIHKSMYGKNFGGEHGVSNVHRILGGHIDMQNRDDGGLDVKPTSMYSNMQNSDKSDLVPSKIMIRNSSDRNDMGIPNSRVFVAPKFLRKNSLRINGTAPAAAKTPTVSKKNIVNDGTHGGVDMNSPADKALARSMRGNND